MANEPTAADIIREARKKNLSLSQTKTLALSKSESARQVESQIQAEKKAGTIYISRPTTRQTTRGGGSSSKTTLPPPPNPQLIQTTSKYGFEMLPPVGVSKPIETKVVAAEKPFTQKVAQFGKEGLELAKAGVGPFLTVYGPGKKIKAIGKAGKTVIQKAAPLVKETAIKTGEFVTKQVERAKPVVSKGIEKSTSFGKGLATSLGLGYVGGKGTQIAIEQTSPQEIREIQSEAEFKSAFGATTKKQEQLIAQEPIYKSLGYQITSLVGNKAQFEELAREELSNRGYKGAELNKAVEAAVKERSAVGYGEVGGLLGSGAGTELFARRQLAGIFAKETAIVPKEKIFGQTFKKTFPTMFQAGAIEGATQEIIQENLRKQDINTTNVLTQAGFGAASAGLLGPTIAASAAAQKKATSSALSVFANVADITEKPSDILASGIELGGRKLTRRSTFSPGVIALGKPNTQIQGYQFTSIETPATKPKGKGAPDQRAPSIFTGLWGKQKTNIAIPTIDVPSFGTPSDVFGGVTKKGKGTTTPIPPPTFTPTTPVNEPTPVFNVVNTPADTTINTFVETPTSVFSFASAVPTFVATAKLPPPLPLSLPSGFGGGFAGKGRGKGYVSELAESQKLLAGLVGAEFNALVPAVAAPKKSSKKKGKEKKKKKKRSSRLHEAIFGW